MSELLLAPLTRALDGIKAERVTLKVLKPPYPCLGRGVLRVVRVADAGPNVEVVVTYDDYIRLGR